MEISFEKENMDEIIFHTNIESHSSVFLKRRCYLCVYVMKLTETGPLAHRVSSGVLSGFWQAL